MSGKAQRPENRLSPGKPGGSIVTLYSHEQYEVICSGKPHFTVQQPVPATAATLFQKYNDLNVYTSTRICHTFSGKSLQ